MTSLKEMLLSSRGRSWPNASFSASGQNEPHKAPSALRIIVVDDDRDMVLSLMMLLREEGHDVRGLHAGKQVLRAVNEFNPDAVVLDIAMPDLSGWEVARAIRARLARRPMLVGISGEYKNSVDRILSEVVGFDHYLLKPYDPNALLALLEPLRQARRDQ
jgi:DNA-binding response OmpR family regulator